MVVLLQFDRSTSATVEEALAGGTATVKVTDFGLSTRMAGSQSHASNMKQGTPFYTAPEVTGRHQLHRESDMYSFGVVMWELITGVLVSYPECVSRLLF